jgi:hypothetical protein
MEIATRARLEIRASPLPLIRRADAPATVDRDARAGRLRRVGVGVYAPVERWRALAPWDRYLARVHAVALMRPDAVFGWESSAALWGMPLIGEPAEVHLLAAEAGLSRRLGEVRTHAAADERDVRAQGGLRLLSPAETAVDLARARHPALALAAADAALRLDGGDAGALLDRNEHRAASRGRRAARWALARATPLGETALESISRALVEWLGFPAPVLQQEFAGPDGEVFRTDMFWPDHGVIGEADGRVKYDGTHGDGLGALIAEKRREDILRRRARGFARWMWRDIDAEPGLRGVLRAAGLREVRQARLAPIESLRVVLRDARRLETSFASRDRTGR